MFHTFLLVKDALKKKSILYNLYTQQSQFNYIHI